MGPPCRTARQSGQKSRLDDEKAPPADTELRRNTPKPQVTYYDAYIFHPKDALFSPLSVVRSSFLATLRARNVSPYKASGSEPPDEGAGAAAAENPELRRAERERRKVSRVRMFHMKHPCAPITPRATARGRANAQAEMPEESRDPELARTRTKPTPSRAQSVRRKAPPAGRARRMQVS